MKLCVPIPAKGPALAWKRSVYGRGRLLLSTRKPRQPAGTEIHAERSCQYFRQATLGPFTKGSD